MSCSGESCTYKALHDIRSIKEGKKGHTKGTRGLNKFTTSIHVPGGKKRTLNWFKDI